MTWQDGRTARLAALFRRRDITGHPELPLLSVYRDYGVVPREGRDDNNNKPGEDLAAYRVVRKGDLVLNKMKTWQGSLGMSEFDGIVSPAYFVGELQTKDDSAFLHHLLRSRHMIDKYGALSKGIRPSQWDLPWDEFRSIQVELPPLATQRAIADYLDRETARIDALIAAKKRMVELLEEASGNWLGREEESLAQEWGLVRLKHVVTGLEQGWSPQCEDRKPQGEEWSVLRAGAVNGGVFNPLERKALPLEGADIYPRFIIQPGDLLINRANGSLHNLGSAAVVPAEAPAQTLLCDKIFRAAVDSRLASAEWIAAMLRAPRVRRQLLLSASGAEGMANSLPGAAILNAAIPLPPMSGQDAFLTVLNRRQRRHSRLESAIRASAQHLRERRQALIAAAVTGGITVPGAAE